MIDTISKLKGHIIVETLDEMGNVLDRFEDPNLIMDSASLVMSELIAGVSTTSDMNKFVIGTKGHVGVDYLTPKTAIDGFVSSRTSLFSEELVEFNYPIVFTNPGTTGGGCAIISEPDTGTTIDLLQTTTYTTYTITIPTAAANNTGTVVFTEAALYSNTRIFCMKCFIGKIKDATVSLKITWTLNF